MPAIFSLQNFKGFEGKHLHVEDAAFDALTTVTGHLCSASGRHNRSQPDAGAVVHFLVTITDLKRLVPVNSHAEQMLRDALETAKP